METDFSRSVFKLSYSDNSPDEYIKLTDIEEYKNYVRNYIKNGNQGKDYIEIKPIQIKFKPHIYELDLITIFHYYTVFLASDKCIDLFEKFKIKKFRYFNESIINGTEYI